MNLKRKISTTTYPISFLMLAAADHITGTTDVDVTATISKNGGAFGAASGAITELGGGLYSWAGNASDRDTLGELWFHAAGTTDDAVDPVDLRIDVVSHDPFADIAAILADTGTDGVVLKAAGLDADAVTEIQAGLAQSTDLISSSDIWEYVTRTLTAGSTDVIAEIRSGLATSTDLSDVATDIDSIIADMADVSEVWTSTTRTLTAGTNIVLAKGTGITGFNDLSASDVTTAASAATPALSATGVDAILDEIVIGDKTLRQAITIIMAKLVGVAAGGGTTTISYDGVNGANNVIVETVNTTTGDRTAVVLTV